MMQNVDWFLLGWFVGFVMGLAICVRSLAICLRAVKQARKSSWKRYPESAVDWGNGDGGGRVLHCPAKDTPPSPQNRTGAADSKPAAPHHVASGV